MVWLEAQHVLEPGQSAVEKAEKYVADARMEWPLARMMLAELSHIPHTERASSSTSTTESKRPSSPFDELVAVIKASHGHDANAWKAILPTYDGSATQWQVLAPLAMDCIPDSDTPLEPLLDVLSVVCLHTLSLSIWGRTGRSPMPVLIHVLEHPALDSVRPACLFVFLVRFFDVIYAYSRSMYAEALKLATHFLLEKRQQTHERDTVRSTALTLGALLIEDRISKALHASLTSSSTEDRLQGDACVSLVLDLYALVLVQGGLTTPRLLRPVGLALVHDAVKTLNACLYLSSITGVAASIRKTYVHDHDPSTANERLFMQWEAGIDAVCVPTVSQRLWKHISLVLSSEEANDVPQVLCAYFLYALSIVAPGYPAPILEVHTPKPLAEMPVPSSSAPASQAYDRLCAGISALVVQLRQGMSCIENAFTVALAHARDTFASMPRVCVSVLPLLGASASTEVSQGAHVIFRALADDSYTRFESLHMLWMDAREAALEGGRSFVVLFVLAARHVAWTLPLARASVSMLDDMLHVLCDRNMGVLLPYIPWGSGMGREADVLFVWTGISECIATMFERIPDWSRTADRQEMLQWIAQVPMLASYMVQSADLACRSNELHSHTDDVLGTLAMPLDCAINWLRLNHEELLQQLSDYIRRAVHLFSTRHIVLPAQVRKHAVDFLGQQLGVTNVQERRTLLSTAQMELLLDEFLALPRSEPKADSKADPKPKTKPRLLQQTLSFTTVPPGLKERTEPKKKPIVVDLTRDSPRTAAPKLKGVSSSTASATRASKLHSTGKLAQLRNEFQLTRSVARKPHAPVRAWEPDEPRAPLATSSVTGTITTMPRAQIRRPTQHPSGHGGSDDSDTNDSDSDADSSSSDGHGARAERGKPSAKGGLAALASPHRAKPTVVRRTVMPMMDPALQEAMRKADDEQRRRRLSTAPSMMPMHECILSWSMSSNEPLPPTKLDGTAFSTSSPGSWHTTASSYTEHFGTLLTLEAWAQFQQACDDVKYAASVDVQYLRQSRVDNFVQLEFAARSTMPAGVYFNETDIVYLELPSRALKLIANVYFSRKQATSQPGSSGLELGIRCLYTHAQNAMPWIQEPGWRIVKLFSLTTLRREYAALCSVPDLAMVQDVLHARVAPLPDVSVADQTKAMRMYELNEPQARAVVATMRTPGFSLIQGPPGTGKTKTIRALVASFLSRRAATSVGPKKAAAPARDGPPARMLLCAPSNAAIDELVSRIKDGVDIDGKRVVPRLVRLGRDEAVNPAVRDVTLDALAEHAGSKDTAASRAAEELQRVERAWRDKRAELEQSASAPTSSTSRERTRALQAELNELTDKRFELREQVSSLQSRSKMGSMRPETERHMARMSILDEAEIVCATLAGAGHEMLYRYTFDTVVIDEAAQAVELSTLIPLRYECTRCILVGDPKQLPPTVLSQEAERRQYAQSLFVRMFNASPDRVHLLSIQYRMHPDISLFPSTAFYGRQLIDGPQMASKTLQPWHNTQLFGPFRFFHVDALEEPGRSHSIQNQSEAYTAMQVYEALCACAQTSLRGRVGFVSMYKAQVDLLRTLFVSQYGRAAAMDVDFSSVDGFQGQEKDIIILSCVRSNKDGVMGFLSDHRRLNVALTRARSNMIVIGNASMLGNDTIWRDMISEARSRGFFVPVRGDTFVHPQRLAPPNQGGRESSQVAAAASGPPTPSSSAAVPKKTPAPSRDAKLRPPLHRKLDSSERASSPTTPSAVRTPKTRTIAAPTPTCPSTSTFAPKASAPAQAPAPSPILSTHKRPVPPQPVQSIPPPVHAKASGQRPSKRKSTEPPPILKAPPRVVPSAALLAPTKAQQPATQRTKKPGKWAAIVERNQASSSSAKPAPSAQIPPVVKADRPPREQGGGPSWLRSARPHSLPRRPS